MGRRKLRFDSRKNFERRKLRRAVTPSEDFTCTSEIVVRLPITSYESSQVTSIDKLQEKMQRLKACPAGWTSTVMSESETNLVFCKLYYTESNVAVQYMLKISSDFTWTVKKGQIVIPTRCSIFSDIALEMNTVKSVIEILTLLDTSKLCCGNNDEKFMELSAWRGGKFMDLSGT